MFAICNRVYRDIHLIKLDKTQYLPPFSQFQKLLISIQGTESQKFNGVINFLCLYDATFMGKSHHYLKT